MQDILVVLVVQDLRLSCPGMRVCPELDWHNLLFAHTRARACVRCPNHSPLMFIQGWRRRCNQPVESVNDFSAGWKNEVDDS